MMRLTCLLAGLLTISCGAANNLNSGCEQNTVYNTTDALGLNDNGITGRELAQRILVTTAATYSSVSLPLFLGGTTFGGGTMTLTIYSDNAATSVPGTAVTGATATVNLNTLTSTTPTLVQFTFTTAPTLAANTRYWLVLSATYAPTTTNIVKWAADDLVNGNSSTYSDGTAKYNSQTSSAGYIDTAIGSGRVLGFQTECE